MITNQDTYTLHINMRRFTGGSGEVKYSTFTVGPASNKYRLTVGGFSTSGSPWRKLVICYKQNRGPTVEPAMSNHFSNTEKVTF